MSNRRASQLTERQRERARYRASHIAQIEALCAPGLTDRERVERFAKAAGFTQSALNYCLQDLTKRCRSPAQSVWFEGYPKLSLFADLPGCNCPVIERLRGVPDRIPDRWQPTRDDLEVFSRIQLERRFPEAVNV